MTKPHGHGDVHALIHSRGIAQRWADEGRKWAVFFQDTNSLVFKTLPVTLGVSANLKLEVNSMAVPRRAGEPIGGIVRLEKDEGSSAAGSSMTVNVEYNLIDAFLRSTTGDGDVNDPDTGYSQYPGSINQLVLAVPQYAKVPYYIFVVLSTECRSTQRCCITVYCHSSALLQYCTVAGCCAAALRLLL
jgi:UDP-sugar pyrophosphorylase